MTTKQIVIAVAAAGLLYWLYKKHSTAMVVAPDNTSNAAGVINQQDPGEGSKQGCKTKPSDVKDCSSIGGYWNPYNCTCYEQATMDNLVVPKSPTQSKSKAGLLIHPLSSMQRLFK